MARIAIVEDDEPIRALVAAVLTDRGHVVLPFATISEAEAALTVDPPDLLITDVDLPDGSGLGLIERLRDACGRAVTSVVLSGHRGEGDFARGFASGAVDYVSKPFSTDELVARVSRCLAQAAAKAGVPKEEVAGSTGLVFGRYEIEKELGRGGYGRVYLARDMTRGGTRVALKVLAPLQGDGEQSVLRFVRECYTLASIENPHVVRVHDFGASGGQRYLALAFVRGVSLHAHVRDRGPLSEVEARWLARGLLRALSALEQVAVVHRDVKPENVMLEGERVDMPVLIDFGLAKRFFDRSVTQSGLVLGTPSYMAPELIGGSEPDHRTDLFALGLTLRFALTGEEVFPGLEGQDLLLAIARGPIPPPPVVLSQGFAALLSSLVARAREQRPPSAAHGLAALEKLPPPAPCAPVAWSVERLRMVTKPKPP